MFIWKEKNGYKYLLLEKFHRYGVTACYTSRISGDDSDFDGLVLSPYRKDNGAEAENKRTAFCRALDLEKEKIVTVNQIHGDRVLKVENPNLIQRQAPQEADALMCRQGKAILITFYADCVPLYFLDPVNRVCALAHAGWRGTAARIGVKTLNSMGQEFGTCAGDCITGIGPAICGTHYRVDRRMVDRFNSIFSFGEEVIFRQEGEFYLDLPRCNRIMLEKAGIPPEQIIMSGMCTYKDREHFYSYRRDSGTTGRMAAILR
ncbi:MAG: peptidoglycan editing factor PgeF [Halanaerobiales bacterium]